MHGSAQRDCSRPWHGQKCNPRVGLATHLIPARGTTYDCSSTPKEFIWYKWKTNARMLCFGEFILPIFFVILRASFSCRHHCTTCSPMFYHGCSTQICCSFSSKMALRTHLLPRCPVGIQAFGADIPEYIYLGMSVLIGLPIFGFVAFEMWKTITENRRARRERRKLEEIQEVMRGE